MKRNIFVKGILGLMVAAGMASCSSDYLEMEPITNIDETKMFENVDNAQRALWGVCRSMYMGYSVGENIQFMNGESWINTMYGEVYGPDAFYYRWQLYGADFMKGNYLRQSNYWMPQMPWTYSYNLIVQCNRIIDNIDKCEGTEDERKYIKAQALTIRAHGYTKLLQYFGPRFEDSENGETLVCPLRLTYGTQDLPLSSFKDVMAQIYKDLDEAIDNYTSVTYNRTALWEPNVDVARGIYARAALLNHDWAKAQKMAHDCRANYPIMTADQYMAGFCDANQEYIWSNYNDTEDQNLGFFSWGALYACNGAYVWTWGIGAGAINYDLYKQMDKKDIRRDLYFTPESPLPPFVTKSTFWNANSVESGTMNINIVNDGKETTLATVARSFFNRVPSEGIGYFQNLAYREGDDTETQMAGIVPFGAQQKFWGAGSFSNSNVPFMRGAEMAFIEAEAAYMQGDEPTAQSVLKEVNSQRITGYDCTKTGDELLKEIQFSKRIELWGEGFCWTDLKRWKLPIIRREWKEKDTTSGNIPEGFGCEIQPEDLNGWRIIIPDVESRYNDLIQKGIY